MINEPESDGVLILLPLSISALFYEYLNLLKTAMKGKKLKEGFVVTWPGNQTWDFPHKDCALC